MLGIRHYRHITTSRVKLAHSSLKKWLGTLSTDFLTVGDLLHLACHRQLAGIRHQWRRNSAVSNLQLGRKFDDITVAGIRDCYAQYKRRITGAASTKFKANDASADDEADDDNKNDADINTNVNADAVVVNPDIHADPDAVDRPCQAFHHRWAIFAGINSGILDHL